MPQGVNPLAWNFRVVRQEGKQELREWRHDDARKPRVSGNLSPSLLRYSQFIILSIFYIVKICRNADGIINFAILIKIRLFSQTLRVSIYIVRRGRKISLSGITAGKTRLATSSSVVADVLTDDSLIKPFFSISRRECEKARPRAPGIMCYPMVSRCCAFVLPPSRVNNCDYW